MPSTHRKPVPTFQPSPVKRDAPASPEPTPIRALADDLVPFSPPERQHEETRPESRSLSTLAHIESLIKPELQLPSALTEATTEFKSLGKEAPKIQQKLNKYTSKRATINDSADKLHAVRAHALDALRSEKVRNAAFDDAYPAILADRHRCLDAALARVKAAASPSEYEKVLKMCASIRSVPKSKPVAPALLHQLSGPSRTEFIQPITHANQHKSNKGHLKGGSGENDVAPAAELIGSGGW
uniref:Uncharacterized protein n=1 Tax=Mycena chlorophos TaxID=658473 RepID=A0ABQ0LH55_MYCCL|nr:predicted protein [Mycena chlorophos]